MAATSKRDDDDAGVRPSVDGSAPPDTANQEAAMVLLAGANPELAAQIKELSAEEAVMFLTMVAKALKKRRILLVGYLLALVLMVGGMTAAFLVYTQREPGQLIGWVFLIPFAVVGLVLIGFGRWARRQ